jgi:hypothetical protein
LFGLASSGSDVRIWQQLFCSVCQNIAVSILTSLLKIQTLKSIRGLKLWEIWGRLNFTLAVHTITYVTWKKRLCKANYRYFLWCKAKWMETIWQVITVAGGIKQKNYQF